MFPAEYKDLLAAPTGPPTTGPVSPAAKAAAAAAAALRAQRNKIQHEHVLQMWYFYASVIGFLTLVNAARYLWAKSAAVPHPSTPEVKEGEKVDTEKLASPKVASSGLQRFISAVATGFRITFFRWSIPVGPGSIASISELTFTFVYIAVNFVWLFVNSRHLNKVMYQDRAAHLASAQLPLIVALAGKNNVLSWLTGIGHEKAFLNFLHRASSRTILILSWIHAGTRIAAGLPPIFDLSHDWMRAGATGLAALTLAAIFSLRPIRNAAFEFFLISHIALILIFLVCVYFHTKKLHHADYIWPALLVWAFDRFLRLARLVWNNRMWDAKHPGDALVELLSEDTVRLTLRRRGVTWKAGQHAYVILPSVSNLPFEAHPFTIASIPEAVNDKKERDVVFLIRGRSGFTGRLRQHAKDKGENRVAAFLDGPYGCPPNLHIYSTCVLVAGGSGVSYTLPLLLDLVSASANGKKSAVRRVVFVWAVRDPAHLKWISRTLTEAIEKAKPSLVIDPRVYITGKGHTLPEVPQASRSADSSDSSDSEKNGDINEADLPMYSALKLIHGRPSMKKLLHEEIEAATGPISVDVAGPSNLADSIRRALATDLATPAAVLKGAQPVTLHVETFGMVKK